MQLNIVSIAVLFALICFASAEGDSQRHCGQNLDKMMSFLCKGQFQGVFDKRSGVAKTPVGRLIDAHHSEQRPFYETLPYAWEAMRQHELAIGQDGDDDAILTAGGQQRFRRSAAARLDWYLHHNIVQECCHNPCTLKQMMGYCRV